MIDRRLLLSTAAASSRPHKDGLFFGWVSWLRRKRPIAHAGRGLSGARVPHGNAAMCKHSGCSGREPSGRGLT